MSSTTVLALNSAESGMERMKVNASKALLVDGSASTQPVSGTFFQATQPISAASALLVDGSAVTQPVSGSVSISGNVNTVGGALSVANNVLWTNESIADGNTETTAGLDISLYKSFIVYGDTDNLSGEIKLEVSFDNTNYYDLGSNLYPDATSGNFVKQVDSDAKYVRISKVNSSGVAESISVSIMIKSG